MGNRLYCDFESQSLVGISGLTVVNTAGSFDFVEDYAPGTGDPYTGWALRANGPCNQGELGLILGPFSASVMNTLYFTQSMQFDSTCKMWLSAEFSSKLFTSTSGIASYHYDESAPFVRIYSGDALGLDDALSHDEAIDHRLTITKDGAITFLHDHFNTPGRLEPNPITWSNGGGGNITTVSGNPALGHPSYASTAMYWALTFELGADDHVIIDELALTTQGTILRKLLSMAAVANGQHQIDATYLDNEDSA